MSLLRVAFFTPLPPARTGTADYAESLVAELQKLVDLQIYEKVPRGFDPDTFDVIVYQIANNPYHAPFYNLALKRPGVVVIHEPNLHDLIKGATLNSGSESGYLQEVKYEIFGREIKDVTTDSAPFDSPQPPTFTMLRRLLDSSKACIVHSNYAEREVRMKNFQGPVAVIPHGASVRRLDAKPFRDALRVAPDALIIGLYGYQRPDKRTMECLKSFRELLQTVPNAHAIVAGEPHSQMDFEGYIREAGLEGKVSVLGFQSEIEAFDGYLNACDVVINLRNPTYGETSGTQMRAFGMGKAVIVSDNGSNRDLPEDICLRIPDDNYEQPVLLECLKLLLTDSPLRNEIGVRAQRWIEGHCSWPQVANLYAAFLETVVRERAAPSTEAASEARKERMPLTSVEIMRYLQRWVNSEAEGASYFKTHARRLVRTVQLTPPGKSDESILEMGCYLQITPALREMLGYGEVRGCHLGPRDQGHTGRVSSRDGKEFHCHIDLFNAETDDFPYPDGHFSTVLCCELLEHLEIDPMYMLSEVHRILKRGGILVLTTPNIVSLRAVGAVLKGKYPPSYHRYQTLKLGGVSEPGHSREYTPDEIRLLLTQAGFLVNSIETGPYGDAQMDDALGMAEILASLKMSTDLRGDCIFAVARKESTPRSRFPGWLYGE